MTSIVLPVYNQADHVGGVVEGYLDALRVVPGSFEIILVPNGCRDNSVTICQELDAKNEEIRCEESSKAGWGAAVIHGLALAKGEHLCYTNLARTTAADLQLIVLYSIANPQVVIKANRKIRESFWRRLGSLLYNLECRALFDLSWWDVNGTPKIFPRGFDALTKLTRPDDLIDLEFSVICREMDYPMLEVPILSSARHGGKSTTKLTSAYKLYRGAYEFKRGRRAGT